MKKNIFILSIIIAIAILFYPQATVSLSTGSPGGKTGSPTDGTDCTSCHNVFSSTAAPNLITSNIPLSGYVPGHTYTITSVHPTSAIHGFEITCEENTSNTKTGAFFITNPQTHFVFERRTCN
jgi:predicted CXXCH cytochrome family protein